MAQVRQATLSVKDRSAVQQFCKALPHALLITADYGLDSYATAKKIADDGKTDIIHLRPLEKKQVISIEQIRELVAALRTYATRRRVIIIRDAHLMTTAAQNAFLKTLEEPNANTHFILISSDRQSLLDTVVSRCQQMTLHKTTPAQDSRILDAYGLDAVSKQQILFLAAGRPRLLDQLATNPTLFAKHKECAADAKYILAAPKYDYQALCRAMAYSTDRQRAIMLIDVISNMLRFQAYSQGVDQRLSTRLQHITTVAQALRSNGNLRLALLQLVVY